MYNDKKRIYRFKSFACGLCSLRKGCFFICIVMFVVIGVVLFVFWNLPGHRFSPTLGAGLASLITPGLLLYGAVYQMHGPVLGAFIMQCIQTPVLVVVPCVALIALEIGEHLDFNAQNWALFGFGIFAGFVLNVYIAVVIYSFYVEVKETQERNRQDQIQLAQLEQHRPDAVTGLARFLENRNKHYRVHPSS